MGVVGQGHAPSDLSPGITQYPLCSRLGGPQGRYPGPRNQTNLEEIRRESVDTVIRVRIGASGSLLCTPSLVKIRGQGILELGDNLLANQGLCSTEIFCFLRHTVSMNFMLFVHIRILKHRKPHYEIINSNLPKSSSTVFLCLCYRYISRIYSYFDCSSCSQFVISCNTNTVLYFLHKIFL